VANAEGRVGGNPWAVLIVLAFGMFMTLLDLTIVNVAIPTLSHDLGATLDQVLWVLNAFSLFYAVLLITSGRVGDIVGPRNLYVAGMLVFTAASAASGFAQDPAELIVARAAQGLGAALLAPQPMPFMTALFPADKRAGAFAFFGALGGLAVLAGPTLGGFIVTHFGWRWIFYVNVPIGIAVIVLTLIVVPDLRPGRSHRLDLLGVVLATAGLFAIVFGLIEGQRYDWGTVWNGVTIPEILGAGAVLLLLFGLSQRLRQDREPLLPFAVFKDRNYTLMTFVLAAMGFAMLGLFLPLTIYWQSVLGLSALEAGLATAAMPLAMMLASGATNALASKIGGKYILLVGLPLFAAGMTYIAWNAHVDSNRWSFLPGLIAGGLGLACVWGPVYSIATRDLRPELAGVASGVINTMQELGGVLASAVIGALLQNRLASALHDRAIDASAQLPSQFRQGFVEGFSNAARSGFQIGAGQFGNSPIQQLAHSVFTNAFVDAMRPALLVSIAVVLLAALCTLGVRQRQAPVAMADPATQQEVA
jgi:EmrB/QacA subfamily drug resistance transporter